MTDETPPETSGVAAAAPATKVAEVVRLIGTLKARYAFAIPFLLACVTAGVNWIVTGSFDATEIKLAAGGFVTGLLTYLGVYQAPAGAAEVKAS